MNWTKQQQAAIETQGKSVIVSAAAGSGKTAVLVERLLRILSDTEHKTPADSMVVVTFTNDAAAQMKQRLNDQLTRKMDTLEEADTEVYDWLLEQRAGLSNARICTIHAFCFELIREHAENCGVSPLFTIAEPAQETLCQQRALQTVMERWSKKTEEMEMLFSSFCAREDKELENVILRIANYMNSLPFRKDWVQRAIALCEDSGALLDRIRADFCETLEELVQIAEMAKSASLAVVPSLPEEQNRYLEKVQTDISMLRQQIKDIRTTSDEELLADPVAGKIAFTAFPRKRAKENTDENARLVCKQFCDLYGEYYKKTLIPGYLEPLRYFAEDMEIQQKLIPLLLELTEEYLEALFAEKRRQNLLGFPDAEELALELLGYTDSEGRIHRTELAEILSKEISLIMVDEYQDSNNKQDCLFKLLSRDAEISEDGLHYGNNAFLVGDVKQSIYSFRQANPENFRRAIAESSPDLSKEGMARIYLNQNFRSASGVLDFVNALFGKLMTAHCGEVRYDEHEQLNYGSPVYTDTNIRTKILLPKPEQALEDMQAECIADTVSSMLQSSAPVIEGGGKHRPCEPKDFCILVRSVKKFGDSLSEALHRRGIPVICDRDAGLLEQEEVRLICNFLRILDNPMADAPMAAVLFSPVYGFTAEELTQLKIHGKKRRLYLQLRAVAENESLLEELQPLQARCTAFLAQLAELRSASEQMALEDCIQQIYDTTDLPSLQSLYEDGTQRREHLDAFLQAAQSYRENSDLSSQSCLGGWLRYLDHLIDTGKDMELKVSASQNNCVSIKTIHKSKGLEYPFVFLAHPEDTFNTNADASNEILAEESGLMGLYLHDREKLLKAHTVTFQYLLGGVRRRQKSEEMRLLYVALTRARQQLFLVMDDVYTGAVKSNLAMCNLGELLEYYPDVAPLLAPRANCMQDWLLCYLLASGEAQHLLKAMDEGISNQSELVEYCVWTKNTAALPSEPALLETHALPDEKLLSQMEQQLGFSYHSPYTELVSKYSVTQLAHPENGAAELVHAPAFTTENGSLSGAAKGTAAHKILQYIDFTAAAQNPAEELNRLQAQGLLNASEAEAITPESLAAFFASDLYQRIAASEEVCREKQLFVRIGELKLPENSVLAEQYAGTDGILIGTMDLLFRDADGWVLVDYKTDYAKSSKELLDKYSLQLGLYQKAAELILGEPVREAYLYSFTLGKALPVRLHDIQY